VRKLLIPAIAVIMLLTACSLTGTGTTRPESLSAPTGSSSDVATPVPAHPTTPKPRPVPSVTLSLPKQSVTSGDQAHLKYDSSNVPAGSRAWLELDYGTPPRWKYVESLGAVAGVATLPGLPTGLYRFRVAILNGIAVVATSASQYLSVVQPPSSSCGICQIFSGAGGAIAGFVLDKAWPWIVQAGKWVIGNLPRPD